MTIIERIIQCNMMSPQQLAEMVKNENKNFQYTTTLTTATSQLSTYELIFHLVN